MSRQLTVVEIESQPRFVLARREPSRLLWDGPIVKRVVDLAVGIPLLIVAAPIIGAACVAVWASSRGPAIFKQVRIGHRDKPFTIYKLRTMRIGMENPAAVEMQRMELLDPDYKPPTSDGAFKPERDPRVTKIGALLRYTSLDELPQLMNVVKGEMSLVGPRPLVPWEVELLSAEARRRTDVPPGITGLWQVNDRYSVSAHEMLELDRDYAANRTLRLDLEIIVRTARNMLRGDGAR
jgi:lipopolysaccharide/colanic/teichoic acid biosynthesis glycosyltransferase